MSSQNNNAPVIISLRDISLVREGRSILENISLDVRRGDFIAITGPNGGGKTTLLRIMLRLLKPGKGKVSYATANEGQLRIGYLPQKNMIDANFPISVKEVIASGLLGIRGISKDESRQRVSSTIELVGMENHADRPIGMLSGGQLQRALLGRAIISQPEVLILDEPLSYIDKQFEARFYEII